VGCRRLSRGDGTELGRARLAGRARDIGQRGSRAGPDDLAHQVAQGVHNVGVERLALGDAFHHVEQHDVAELLLGREKCEVAADLTCADEGDLPASHEHSPPGVVEAGATYSTCEGAATVLRSAG